MAWTLISSVPTSGMRTAPSLTGLPAAPAPSQSWELFGSSNLIVKRMHRHAQIRWQLTYAIFALVVTTGGLLFAYRVLHQPPSGAPSSEELANKGIGSVLKPASPLVNKGHLGRFSPSKPPPIGRGVPNDPKVGSEPTNAES